MTSLKRVTSARRKPSDPVGVATSRPPARTKEAIALQPHFGAAALISTYTKSLAELDELEIVRALQAGILAMAAGNMGEAEQMLLSQAQALQAMFFSLALRAGRLDQLSQWEPTLRMALKAQNQCRMTLESLASLKNPGVVIAKHANVVHGPQQINHLPNTTGSPSFASAKRSTRPKSKLNSNGKPLDS